MSGAGDFNGDGFADLIIGAHNTDPGGDRNAGESYVVFGKASGFAASLDLASLDETEIFRFDGIDVNDFSGESVSGGGDVNGDGFDDIIIGARRADPGGVNYAGESYIIFGGNFTNSVSHAGTAGSDTLIGDAGANVMLGGAGGDTLIGGGGDDRITGGVGDDVLTGGAGDDLFVFRDGDGADTITDFTAGAASEDVLNLFGVSRLGGFAAVQNIASQVGADTLLDFGGGDTITLLGVDLAALHPDDFLI